MPRRCCGHKDGVAVLYGPLIVVILVGLITPVKRLLTPATCVGQTTWCASVLPTVLHDADFGTSRFRMLLIAFGMQEKRSLCVVMSSGFGCGCCALDNVCRTLLCPIRSC